jgi:hypothetical protein
MRDPARGKNQKTRILSPLAIPETIAADRDTERPIRRVDRREPMDEKQRRSFAFGGTRLTRPLSEIR